MRTRKPFFLVGRGPQHFPGFYVESSGKPADLLDAFTLAEPCPCGSRRGIHGRYGPVCRRCGQPVSAAVARPRRVRES